MGSIIGGLYASGMSPDEIEQAFRAIDWDHIFSDAPPREVRSFRRKRDDDLYVDKARVGFNDGQIDLPTGLIQGQKFDLVLRKLTLPVSHIEDFNKLPIPYRAVATNINTGKAVVFDNGDLARAMRASMAVPGVFAAVQIDGLTLVDGGIADNLPIDVVRNMGADIVIAVNISTPLDTTKKLNNLLKISGQLIGFLTTRNVEVQLATLRDEDVLLVPELGDLTSSDFTRAIQFIPAGEAAAHEKQAALNTLSVSDEDYSAYLGSHNPSAGSVPVIEFVTITNNSNVSDSLIRERISQQQGTALDIPRLEADIGSIYGLELFENVDYEVVDKDGRTGIDIVARRQDWGPNYLQFGLALSGDWSGENSYNIGLAYLKTAINPLGGEVRFAGQLGSKPLLSVDWYQPLDARARYFIEPTVVYAKQNVTLYSPDGQTRIAEYRVSDAGVQLAGGVNIGEYGEARLGIRRSWGDVDLNVGTPGLPTGSYDRGSFFGQLWVDRLNDAYFPTDGYTGKVKYTIYRDALGNDGSLDQLELQTSRYMSFGKHTFGVGAIYNTTLDGDAAVQDRYFLGGFLDLSGYDENALNGPHSALLSAVYYRRFEKLKLLPWYLGASLEFGNVWERRDDMSFDSAIFAGSVFLGAESPLGPLYLGYGHAEQGRSAAFLFLGKTFR
ncbi:MAG: patatin-like phospholipase family protein [Gammaproteobacteria bacterium]